MTTVPIYISWLNYLGGFEYFFFTSKKEFQVEVGETGEATNNILPNYPQSYGKTADTLRKQTFRTSRNKILIRSQHLTFNQLTALSTIKDSPLVQIIESRTDRRTIIVDADSFKKYDEQDKLFTFQFTGSYTDDNPSQRV
jgi:hypothetical protein